MDWNRHFDRIKRVDQLIRMKATGTPKELAGRLGVSEKTVYCIINDMKEVLGGPIAYCRERRSYYYTKEVRLRLGWIPDKSEPKEGEEEE